MTGAAEVPGEVETGQAGRWDVDGLALGMAHDADGLPVATAATASS